VSAGIRQLSAKPKVLALVAYAALAACNGDKPGEWSLFVYADSADHQKWQRTDRFQSEGMCRQAGEEAVAALPDPAKASFECRHTGAPA
jgi:hypothetical protein